MSAFEPRPLRLGTRSSPLALVQATWVASALAKAGHEVELVHIETDGDRSTQPLAQSAGMGLFTKAIQRALLDNTVDLAVHSLKDLPTDNIPGLALAAVPERATVNDMLVSADGRSIEQLEEGAKIGTGSLRRRAQLLHARNDVEVVEIRGNVDTRIQKLSDHELDAIILAEAGLERLGRIDERCWSIPLTLMLPAVGQGALGIEARSEDDATLERVCSLDDRPARAAVLAERSMLKALTAGCLAPVGALATIEESRLHLSAAVFSQDGKQRIDAGCDGSLAAAEEVGAQLADELLRLGAGPLIEAVR